MTTKKEMEHRFKHRAVAPIIATLLMVAISVVGGILIFVFAQGFFTDSSIHSPALESLEIFGFDARDEVDLRPHNFDPAVTAESTTFGAAVKMNGASNGKLAVSDAIALYLRNKGSSAVTISKIAIFGLDYQLDTTVGCSDSVPTPAKTKFSMTLTGKLADCKAGSNVIGIGQEATLFIRFDDANSGPVKIGRPIVVTVVTGNGATSYKQVQNGVQQGS